MTPVDDKTFATLQAAAALEGICVDRIPDGMDRCRYLVRTHLRTIDCVDLGAVRVALVRQAGELDAHRSRK